MGHLIRGIKEIKKEKRLMALSKENEKIIINVFFYEYRK
jgi:hypothetical protein